MKACHRRPTQSLRSARQGRRNSLLVLLWVSSLSISVAASSANLYGYAEGSVNYGYQGSNVYAPGTHVIFNFSYDPQDEFNVYAWCTETFCYYSPKKVSLTIGADVFEVGNSDYFGHELDIFNDNETYGDAFIVNASDSICPFSFCSYQDQRRVRSAGIAVTNIGDFLSNLSLPTSMSIRGSNIGFGAWDDYLYSDPTRFDFARFRLNVFVIMDPGEALAKLQDDVSGVGPGNSLADQIVVARAYYGAGDCQSTQAVLSDVADKIQSLLSSKKPRGATQALLDSVVSISKAYACSVQ